MGDYIADYYSGYKDDIRSLDYGSCKTSARTRTRASKITWSPQLVAFIVSLQPPSPTLLYPNPASCKPVFNPMFMSCLLSLVLMIV